MSGSKGISTLRKPRKRYSPVGKHRFETKAEVWKRDEGRARALRQRARSSPKSAAAYSRLADQIDPAVTRKPTSTSSARYMRKRRISWAGAVWELHERHGGSGTTFTLILRGQHYTRQQLLTVRPVQLLSKIRSALLRERAALEISQQRLWQGEYLLLGLHGEHNPLTGLFQLHFHGYCSPRWVEVLKALRARRAFRPKSEEHPDAVTFPIVIAQETLGNFPKPFLYLLQGWFPSRARSDPADTAKSGDRKSTTNPRRRQISEPANTTLLRWLDRWRVEEMILMIGARVIKGKLQVR